MKRILVAFLLGLITMNSYAFNIHIVGEYASKVLNKFFPDKKVMSDVVDVYNEELEKNEGTLSAESVAKISDAAGWDREKDKDIRAEFRRELVASPQYYEVCGDDQGKTGGDEHCIEDVFYAGLNADIKMTMLQAEGLCKEYARVKYNDDIECSNETRGKLNDYVKCASKLKPIYYEFKFDSVTGANLDSVLHNSVKYSVCKIHETNLGFPKSTAIDHNAKSVDYNSFCVTSDKTKCSQINDSMGKFAYKSFIKDGKCVIDQKYDITKDNLRTAFGINNYNFDKGYQLSAYNDLREKLCEYIKKNANTTINTCECDYNFTRIVDNSGPIPEADDVLTCHANEQPIDFLFDDLNENVKKLSSGNMEAFNCTVLGGEYQGKTCFTPDASLCDEIAKATKKECPECAEAYFDTEQNACVLPNSAAAIQHQKNVNIGLIVGGAVVGAAVISVTGGTGATIVALAIETVGAGIEIGAQVYIDGIADEFFMKANNCNNAKCAEEILQEYFQYLSRMVGDLKDGEKIGVDAKMATLVSMVPDDSQFLIDVVAGCYEKTGDNFDISKCDDGNWNGAQIIRAIGIGMQFASVVGSATKAILTKTGMIEKMANATPKLTTALSKKIPGVKARIAQKLAKGQKVARSDGKAIKALSASKPDDVAKGTAKTAQAAQDTQKTMFKSAESVENISDLRRAASSNFDIYLAEAKNNANGKSTHIILKNRLNDDGWLALNKSLANENIQLVEITKDGEKYMQFVRAERVDNVATASTKAATETKKVITQKSLTEIEVMHQQKLSDDVLELQKSQGMARKVEKYNDAMKRAKESLSPEEYKAFESMVEQERYIAEQDAYIEKVESNLRSHNFSEATIDTYLADKVSEVREARAHLNEFYKKHPQASDFMDDNYLDITNPNDIILKSDDAVIQKKVAMTAEISKHVDDAALTNNVQRFKEDIIANFPKEMYQKAKNWNQLSGPDKAKFVAYELIPYLQKQQGLAQTKIEVQLLPASHIGGNASFCDGTKCMSVSFESLNNASFESMLETLSHETVHAGQYIEGGRSLLSKDIIAVSDANYVAALRNLDANRANAVEREAYKTTGMFNNILDEIAKYHNW